jgi:hypothetical protein
MDDRGGFVTDILIGFVLFCVAVIAAVCIIKLYDEHFYGKKSEVYSRVAKMEATVREFDRLLNSNIATVGKCNQNVEEVKKDMFCLTGKVDKTDEQLDNLQEHCAKLRDSQIDLRELLSKKRPIHRHDPIVISVHSGKVKELIPKLKKQLEELKQ